jgi:hypothetical protein
MKKVETEMDELRPEYDLKSLRVRRPGGEEFPRVGGAPGA